MSSLRHQCVMVTRPDPQGSELCRLIEAHDGEAIFFPTIRVAPPNDLQSFQDALNQIGYQDWLIFVSQHAVYATVPKLRMIWPNLPPGVKFAAVGESTARALQEAGYQATIYPDMEWNSEALLALPEFQAVQGAKIAIIRGENGRTLLTETLEARGAEILSVIAYKREIPTMNTDIYVQMFKQKKINSIVCASVEAVQNLKLLLGGKIWSNLKTVPLIVISERMKALAQDLGFQSIWSARNPSHQAILEVLAQQVRNKA